MRVISWRIFFAMLSSLSICVVLIHRYSQTPETLVNVQVYNNIYLEPFLVSPNRSPLHIPNLPNLSLLNWPALQAAPTPAGIRTEEGGKVQPLPEAFEPVMSRGQHELCKHLLRLFSQLMFDNGYGDRFILYGGTLIGSFRHHDIIPWDDDLDLLVDVTIRPKVQALLESLAPKYGLTKQRDRDKFYTGISPAFEINATDAMISRRSSAYSWGWPYLDIGYYRVNSTHVGEIASSYGRTYEWPKDVMFPLRLRPLGREWYPAPYRTAEFLRATYGENKQCVIYGYSHVLEGGGPSGRRDCADLSHRYAFVQHMKAKETNHKLVTPSTIADPFVMGEERLVLRDVVGRPYVIHSLIMPVLESETRSETYGFGERS